MDEVKAIKPNKLGMMFANTIRAGRDTLNYPGKVAGIGAGDLLFGQGPELAEEMAHGFPPYKGTGYGTRVDTRLLDLAGTPTFGLGTLIAKGPSLMSKLIRRGASGATDEGRREFMKKGAALAGGAAASGTGANMMVDLIRSAGKEAIPAATAATARAAVTDMGLINSLGKWAKDPALVNSFLNDVRHQFPSENFQYLASEISKDDGFRNSLNALIKEYPAMTDDFLERNLTYKLPGGVEPDYDLSIAHWLYKDPGTWKEIDQDKLRKMEEYFITGKLPEGVPPEYARADPWDWLASADSRLNELMTPVIEQLSTAERGGVNLYGYAPNSSPQAIEDAIKAGKASLTPGAKETLR